MIVPGLLGQRKFAGVRAVRRRIRQKSAVSQRGYAVLDRLHNAGYIGLRVRRRQKAIAPFPNIDALIQHVVVKQLQIALERKPEQRTEIIDPDRHLFLGKEAVQSLRQIGGFRIQLRLQLFPVALQPFQHGKRCRHGERMVAEGTRNKCAPFLMLRIRTVAEIPHASIDAVHKSGTASHDADRQPASDHFAVGDQIRLNAEPRLRPAGMKPETGDHLIENKSGARLFGRLPNRRQKRPRLQTRSAALHRLHQHRRQFMGVFANIGQRRLGAVRKHNDVIYHPGRHSRRQRHRPLPVRARAGKRKHAVKRAVVRTRK